MESYQKADPVAIDGVFTGQVLVVEDDEINAQVIQAMLKKFGLAVRLVGDGQQALEAIMSGDAADLILMDLQMPVIDGCTATQKIRQWETATNRIHRPIVALTASVFEENRQYCLSVGMNGFLTKPIMLDDLKAALSQWLVAMPGTPNQASSAIKPLDVPKVLTIIRKLIPLLEQHQYDAISCFNELRTVLTNTELNAEIAKVGELVKKIKFDLVLDELHKIMRSRGWEKIC